MRNMFVSDVRRLLRMRAFYVSLAALAAVILLLAYGTWMNTQKDVSDLISMVGEETGQDLTAMEGPARAMSSMGMSPQMMLRRQMTTRRLLTAPFKGRLPHLLISVLAALLIGKDIQSGYMKNLITLKGFRRHWYWSKLCVMVLAALLLYLSLFPFAYAGTWMLGNPVSLSMQEATPLLVGNFLASLALIALMMLVLMLLQNRTAALVLGVLLPSGILTLVYKLIDLAGILPFKLSGALLMEQVLLLGETGITPQFLWTAFGVLACSLIGGRLLLEKQDLRL